MTAALLRASSLYRFYHVGEQEIFALRGVDLTIEAGEFVAIMGPSGSGKSTLLACLAGLDEPSGGKVELAGIPVTRRPEADRARMRAAMLGVMSQSGNLFSHLSVLDNIRLQQRLSPKRRKPEPSFLLGAVGLGHRGGAFPAMLSGGEAARAGLAVALAADPRILLCDEPTGEVDQITETAIVELLRQRREEGAAVLVATHSAVLAGRADRVLHIAEGALQ